MTVRDPDPQLDLAAVHTVLCDLDGVVWLARDPIPGAAEAIAQIRDSGRRVLFVSNNSVAIEGEVVEALASIGVPADDDVVTSAMAAAALVEPASAVLVAGSRGVVEAIERRGARAVLNDGTAGVDGVDAVVVGLHRDFDYGRLARASSAVRAGARFIATNDDATFPTPTGLDPGGGSIVAAVATASGVAPIIAGKPHRPMADLIISRLGRAGRDPGGLLMVGDRPSTDGRFAETLGCPFALVRTGVVPEGATAPTGTPVSLDVPDLAALGGVFGDVPARGDTLGR